MSSRYVHLNFIDGIETGWVSSEFGGNNNLIAIRIPEGKLDEDKGKNSEPLSHSGIYILLGINKEKKYTAYIGQAQKRESGETFKQRFKEHEKTDKTEFWKGTTIVVTKKLAPTNDNNFTSTDLDYLEDLFIEKAVNADKCVVKNIKRPDPNSVPMNDYQRNDCDEDFNDALMLIYSLGCDIFVKDDLTLNDSNENQEDIKDDERKEGVNSNLAVPLGRNDVKDICALSDCAITSNLSRAKRGGLDGLGRAYANDSNYSVLDSDWTLALDNYIEQTLYIFIIPQGELKREDVAPKHSEEGTFSINIKNDYPVFTDTRRSIKFGKYLKATIDYKNREKPICELNDKYMQDVKATKGKAKKPRSKIKNITKPTDFVFLGKTYKVNNWVDIIDSVMQLLCEMDPDKMFILAEDNFSISKKKDNAKAFITFNIDTSIKERYHQVSVNGQVIYYNININKGTEIIFLNSLIKEFCGPDEYIKINEIKIEKK